ncbi:MAG: sigma-70 family RNA polymerase sigma factor [Burkholderiales bacterium]|nr:sigma-70 family RNA polymerase sigma factor [Phycisphaerae bacterium]
MVRLTTQPTSGVDLLTQYCASGAPDVFAQIMRAYGGMVFSVCLKVTGDAADAEDASQATFLTLAVQCKTGAKISYLGPWLKKVAKRSSLDLVRSRKRRTRRENITAEGRPEFYATHPGARSADGEISQIIHSELDELPAKYRMPLVLHYFGGLSHTEISSEMRCTPAALGVRLHRGRKMLGKRLRARGVTLDGAALGVALAASVHQSLGEHFIHTTTAAASMAWSRPGFAAASALGAALPGSLGIVPQLVQEVARSMAHARLKMATFALALSITMLGGAAEAVRHLPASIRPSFDFLSPARALENLFRSVTPTPRAAVDESSGKSAVAQATSKSEQNQVDVDYAPRVVIPAPLTAATQQPPVRYSPVLALRIPTVTPPLSTHMAEQIKASQARANANNAAQPQPRLSVTAAPEPTENRSTANVRPADTSTSDGATSPDRSPQNLEPVAAISGTHGDGTSGVALSTFVPSNLGYTTASVNAPNSVPLAQSRSAEGSGTIMAAGVNPMPAHSVADGTVSEDVLQAIVNDSLMLRPNDLFVCAADREYSWSDSAVGIEKGGVHSIQFTLTDVAAPGVLSIERLSRKTTLAPARPLGHTFIGLWGVRTEVDYASLNMTVHYDEALAQSLGLQEDVLKLWVYSGDSWLRINDSTFARDLTNHTLSGDGKMVQFIGVSAPEPSLLGVLGILAGGLLRRRRRAR